MKYFVRHWITVDMIAEEVIDGDGVDLKTNNIGKYEEPSDNAAPVFRRIAPRSDFGMLTRPTVLPMHPWLETSGQHRLL